MDLLNLPHPQVYSYYYSRFFFFRSVSFDDLSIAKLCAQIKNHYKGEEILFLGPDEGTAGLMDWAANHARKRGSLSFLSSLRCPCLTRWQVPVLEGVHNGQVAAAGRHPT